MKKIAEKTLGVNKKRETNEWFAVFEENTDENENKYEQETKKAKRVCRRKR